MKKYLGLISIIGCLLGFSHGVDNLRGLCRDDTDCSGGAECFGYFCYPWDDGETPPLNEKKICKKNNDCEAEGPDVKCMKTHKGKGLCQKAFQDCDSDGECDTNKGEKCCNDFICCSPEIYKELISTDFDCCSEHVQELIANQGKGLAKNNDLARIIFGAGEENRTYARNNFEEEESSSTMKDNDVEENTVNKRNNLEDENSTTSKSDNGEEKTTTASNNNDGEEKMSAKNNAGSSQRMKYWILLLCLILFK